MIGAWKKFLLLESIPRLFLLLVAYLPFQLALNLAPDIDLMSGRVLIFGLFFLWLAGEFYWNKKRARDFFLDQTSLALVAFFFLAAISILAADNQLWGTRKLLVWLSIFPLFWLTRFLASEDKTRRALIAVIVVGGALSAGLALAQFGAQFIFSRQALLDFWASKILPMFSGASFGALVAGNPSWLVEISGQTLMRAIGLFPDPHMLAFYLGITFPFALSLFIFGQRRRFLLLIVNCLSLIALLLTFSRGGYLGLLAALAVFGLLGGRRFSQSAKKFLAAAVLLALGILLLAGWPVLARLSASFDPGEGSNLGRLAIWQDSWQMIKGSPFIGVGLGNYSLAVNFNDQYRSAVTSHNLYLDFWVELGIFGLLAWLAVILTAARTAYKKIKSDPVVALGVLAGLTYFTAHSFFESAIFNPTVLAFLMIVLGLATVDGEKIYKNTK